MRIVGIDQCKFAVGGLVRPQFEEWKHLSPQYSEQCFIDWAGRIVRNHETDSGIERMFVAVNDVEVFGSICLLEKDLPERTDIGPWFASLYVIPHHRQRGIATALGHHLVDYCRGRGHIPLYLVCEKEWLANWYAREFGFQVFERGEQRGYPVIYMVLSS